MVFILASWYHKNFASKLDQSIIALKMRELSSPFLPSHHQKKLYHLRTVCDP